jgi:hypothetical protein
MCVCNGELENVYNSDSATIACSPELYKGISVNKSNHEIQNPLLFVTEPRTRDSMFTGR